MIINYIYTDTKDLHFKNAVLFISESENTKIKEF